MNKYTLQKFVTLCNASAYQIADEAKDEAYYLGKDFEKLFNAYNDNEDIEKVAVCKENNREFFKCLLARKDAQGYLITDKYIFMQDKNIIAEINVFEPYEDGIFSQKWHVLISLLALLDTVNFDVNYKLPNTFSVKGKINNIEVDKEKNIFRIKSIKNGKSYNTPYYSKSMKQWIFRTTDNETSKS